MHSLSALVACLVLCSAAGAQQPPLVAPSDARSPADELKAFKLPPGFEAQLVASEPLIGKPIQCAFDARGRLWVTTSRHYPFAAEGKASDKLYVLSDIDPATGKAGSVTAFASDLNIPIGVLPLPDCNSCLVGEVGRVVKLSDTDGDGKADVRETILEGFGTRDTHGMMNSFTLLPDGWVYACHGFSNSSRVKAKDGSEVVMQSGNTFRFRPDGSRVEPWTFGQVNPFGMTVDPWFNLYTADCHSKPITQLIRGAYYDSFGKPHDGLGYAPHVTRHDHGSTGLCGLAWLDSPALPPSWRGGMVLGNVVTNKVNSDRIKWHGSTPEAIEAADLLASGDPWFRPADCKQGPDGAVYVTDFYNKVIGHYEVDLKHPGRDKDRGRVWRIVYRGQDAKPADNPGDLTKLAADKLDALLGHPSISVRLPATIEMQRRGKPPAARADGNEFYKAHRWWLRGEAVAGGGRRLRADEAPRMGADDVTELESVHRSRSDLAFGAPSDVAHNGPHHLRAYLDRTSVNPKADALPGLLFFVASLNGSEAPADTHARHALRIALRNSLAAPGGWAMAAKLTADPSYRDYYLEVLGAAALGVPSAEAAAFLAAGPDLSPVALKHVGRYGDDATVARVVAGLAGRGPAALAGLQALHEGRQAKGRPLPADALTLATRLCDEGLTRGGSAASANLVATLKITTLADPLAKLAARGDRPAGDRVAAAHALAVCHPDRAAAVLAPVLGDPAAEVGLREQVAAALARANTTAAREALVNSFKVAPAKVAQAVALALAGSPDGAKALVDAVSAGKASPQLLAARATRDKLQQSAKGDLVTTITKLTKNVPGDDARLAGVMRARQQQFAAAKGDAALGNAVFAKNCAACHQIAGTGGKVGPNLDGVGTRGLERLLEDVLTPNRNVDAAFRATTLQLTDGRTLTGLVLREEGKVTVIADAAGQEVRVSAADIDARTVTSLSPMPANFDTAVPEDEFRHLMAYLLSQRQQ